MKVPPDWTWRPLGVNSTPTSSPATKTHRHRPTVFHTEKSLWSPRCCDADVLVGRQQAGLNTPPWPHRKTRWNWVSQLWTGQRPRLPVPTPPTYKYRWRCHSNMFVPVTGMDRCENFHTSGQNFWDFWPSHLCAVSMKIGQFLNNCGDSKEHKSINMTRPPWQHVKKDPPPKKHNVIESIRIPDHQLSSCGPWHHKSALRRGPLGLSMTNHVGNRLMHLLCFALKTVHAADLLLLPPPRWFQMSDAPHDGCHVCWSW